MTYINLIVAVGFIHGFILVQYAYTAPATPTAVPEHHPGPESELPSDVFTQGVGTVLTTTTKNDLILRRGSNIEQCNKLCRDEISISCHFYRYLKSKEMCLLMRYKIQSREADGLETDANIPGEAVSDNEMGIGPDVANISVHDQQISETLSSLEEQQKTTDDNVNKLKTVNNKIATSIVELSAKLNTVAMELASLKLTNVDLSKKFLSSKTNSPVLDREITSIKRDIDDMKSKLEMNPTVFKMTKNQRILAEALESIDRELTVFERKLDSIDDISDEMSGRVSKEELHRKTLNEALQILTTAVRAIRKDINKLENPLSSYNIEKTNAIKAMRSDIDILSRSNKKLEKDMSKKGMEMTNLLKDMVAIQEAQQNSRTAIATLVETNRNTMEDFKHMRSDQDQMMNKIQMLASVYRSVLTALHNLEIKEIEVMHRLNHYDDVLNKLNANFLERGLLGGNGSLRAPLVSSNLANYSNLLKSQKQLYSQMVELQKQVENIKNPGPGSKSKNQDSDTEEGEDGEEDDDDEDEEGEVDTKEKPVAGRLNLYDKMEEIRRLDKEVNQAKERITMNKELDSMVVENKSQKKKKITKRGGVY